MPAEVKLTEVAEKPTSISRRFEVLTVPPIIGRIVLTSVNEGEEPNGFIETTSPCTSEINVKANVLRPLEISNVVNDSECAELLMAALSNSRYFNGML